MKASSERSRTSSTPFRLLSGLFVALLFVGCAPPESIPLDVPEGWESAGEKWWRAGVDTTGLFRDLETLSSMGVMGGGSLAPVAAANNDELGRRRLATHVKDSLIPLFRNAPDVVDSLFERFVVPKMANANVRGDVRPLVSAYKLEGYRTISRHFREPYSLTKMGLDIPVPIPDSLREKSIVGRVFMQVYISKDGDPIAIRKLRGVHAVLDRIALRAMTQMKWQPAYLLRGAKSDPIPSWARFNVDFASVL